MRNKLLYSFLLSSACSFSGIAWSDDAGDKKEDPSKIAATSSSTTDKSGSSSTKSSSSSSAHAAVLKDAKTYSGLLTVYQKGSKLYGELTSSNYSSEYIILTSIARGTAGSWVLGGMSWGDDGVWKFRKVDDRVHVIRKNVRFKAKPGTPEATAVRNAYTDSVLYSLPVVTKGPKGGDLVDLSSIFMSDHPQISRELPGFSFSSSKSSWASIKAFPDNMELEVAATYASSGRTNFDTVADSRGATINVHYSISKVPSTGYQPRLADQRVGYFLTVVKDYSKNDPYGDRFLRFINRWDLQKADSSAKLSPPKKPIIFWIAKTFPYKYRKTVHEGIAEWNKAFEKAGFANAIEVRQQPDNADWDAEDINYNTIRWITSDAPFSGIGPSRVNPYTGQILDADILLDSNSLSFYKPLYESLTPASVRAMSDDDPFGDVMNDPKRFDNLHLHRWRLCELSQGMSRQFAFGASTIAAWSDQAAHVANIEKMMEQGLKSLVMHEVGHTLGLRHNFKGSTLWKLKDLNNPNKVKDTGLLASVMDYDAINIAPKGEKQGDYFTTTIGPYDIWAIEYGYKPLSGGTFGEKKDLEKIASRSGEPGLAYATDEDSRGNQPDPDATLFDLGKDSLEFAKTQAQLVHDAIPGMVERTTENGDDYYKARRAFNILVAKHGEAMFIAARNIGGLYTHRNYKGDKNGKTPFEVVPAKRQREALKLIEDELLSDKPFSFPAEIYNQLGPSFWRHWGASTTRRKDFPVHDFVLMWQDQVLSQLLSSTTLDRLHDSEAKIPADQDAFTTAELIDGLTHSIFSEVDSLDKGKFTTRKPAISSLRRNLQRSYLRRLSYLAMGRLGAPEDCQTVAFAELGSLKDRIDGLLKRDNIKLDAYSQAHLIESKSRIEKVLDARLSLLGP